MGRFEIQNCNCKDYPNCGCDSNEVLTGQDALDLQDDVLLDDLDDDDFVNYYEGLDDDA